MKPDKNQKDTNKASEHFRVHEDVSSEPFRSNPENCLEMINTYGTYEIQPTANSSNEFPAISQGLPSRDVHDMPDNFHEGIIPD